MVKNKKTLTTYERHIQKMTSERKEQFDKGYRDLIISEIRIAFLNKDYALVKLLTKELDYKN